MNAIFWLGIVELIVFGLMGLLLIGELRSLRAVLTELLGSVAQASWRTKDELAAMTRRGPQ